MTELTPKVDGFLRTFEEYWRLQENMGCGDTVTSLYEIRGFSNVNISQDMAGIQIEGAPTL